jgi:CO/xanthine dehydrogenase FAD-binding subunit
MKKYIYKGKSVPGMYEGDLPKGQFGNLEETKKTISDWTNKNKGTIKGGGRAAAKTLGTMLDPLGIVDAENKIIKRGRNVANKINKWFGGSDNYWKRGGGLR